MVDWSTIEGPLLFAHRGANRERPENTLPAFELGVELGADVLELDVHPSRDGIFVVSHDPSGLRTCGVDRELGACNWSEIASWDAGFGFLDAGGQRPFAGQGVRLPRFEDVIDAFPKALFNVDLKEAREHELGSLLGSLRARQAQPRVLLTSFSAKVLQTVRKLGWEGPLGLAERDVVRLVFSPTFLLRLLPLAGSRVQIPTRSGLVDLSSSRFIEKCHGLGLKVDYWVIDEPEEARRLLERGADGIITDDTRALADVFSASAL